MVNETVLTSTMTVICCTYVKNTCIRRVMLARPLEVWSLAIFLPVKVESVASVLWTELLKKVGSSSLSWAFGSSGYSSPELR